MVCIALKHFFTQRVFLSAARSSLREGADSVEQAIQLKCDLLKSIEKLGSRLPKNTLDELIDELGGTDMVSEVQ